MCASGASIYAVITAAGSGLRLGANKPKALVEVAEKPLLLHALNHCVQVERMRAIVITAPKDALSEFESLIAGETPANIPVFVVPGGATRQESVHAGLEALAEKFDEDAIVLVHDAARAFTPVSVYQRVIAAIEAGARAVVPVVAAVDTMRISAADSDLPGIEVASGELDRATVRIVQTPQGFRAQELLAAHRQARVEVTDDAALLAQQGAKVYLVAGDERALKITHREDIARIEFLSGIQMLTK